MKTIARFSDEWIERVKSSFDIVDVIGQRVELKQSGRNFLGLCPFHDEKTASFSVNQEKQFYHCFGCHAGGNVINFVMETEHLSFPEAVSKLAKEKGIPIPNLSPRDSELANKREKIRKINETAARFYYRNLRQDPGQAARAYLEGRGIDQVLARNFFVGYALKDWDGLVRFFEQENIDLELAEEAGLITLGRQGYIDRFRDRIMFPICDHIGRFIGFGGRSMRSNQPKYLNTAQTPVFNKSYVLYGLNWAKEEIKKHDYTIIVEGYTDVIALFSAGFKNVVASLGTAFTGNHAKLLNRFSTKAIIAFDGDVAGQNATLNGIRTLYDNGLLVRVAKLAEGEDPDGFVQKNSSEQVDKWLNLAQPFREYELDRIISQHDVETREGKLAASKEVVTLLAKMTNSIERDEYIRYGAQALNISEHSLSAEVNQNMGIDRDLVEQYKYNKENVPLSKSTKGEELVEREIIRCLLAEPDRLHELREFGVTHQDFLQPDYRHLYYLFSQSQSDQRGTSLTGELLSLGDLSGNWEDYLKSFLLMLKKRRLQNIEGKLSSLENDRKGFDIRMELYFLLKEYYGLLNTKS